MRILENVICMCFLKNVEIKTAWLIEIGTSEWPIVCLQPIVL